MATMLACLGVGAADAQSYPVKPIRIIVPFAPGGPNDILARAVGMKLSESLGQQVIADNRPGGGTVIGTELVARAPADGYTLLMASTSHTVNPALVRSLPFDQLRDFTYVSWYGVLAPTGAPREIIARLNAEISRSLRELEPMLLRDGAEVVGGTPEEFAVFFRAEMAKWAAVIKEAGLKPN